MNSRYLILILSLLILIIIKEGSGQLDELYSTCNGSFTCGTISGFGFPFWRNPNPVHCAYPGFKVNCDEQNPPTINIMNITYHVLSINSTTQILKIVREDMINSICPQNMVNTTMDYELFDYASGYMNMSLFFGCPDSFNVTGIGSISCSNNGVNPVFVLPGTQGPGICNTSVIVPVPVPVGVSELGQLLQEGFEVRWKVKTEACSDCLRSGGQCMYNNDTSLITCSSKSAGSKRTVWKLIIGLSWGIAGIMLFLFVILYRKRKLHKAQKTANTQIEIFIRNNGSLAPKRCKYSEIKQMTNSFAEKIGQGAFGSVYKGQLPGGKLVAVKLLDGAMRDGEDFINEVASIGRTSHVNIVTLLGFCFEGKKRALMYEFMPNGSLDKFLHDDGSRLDWNTLFLIAKGIARGLEYLHQGCNTRIVHFDIKPHNILLDEEFVPKISDFGLAKLCKRKKSVVSILGARGTFGYMAPEVILKSLGGASHKSDVYSYGMMILEMAGARKKKNFNTTSMSEAYFPDWIYKQVERGDNLGVDWVTTEEEEELARKMVMVSLWCIQSNPSDRPSISKVVEMLEGSFLSLEVPPKGFWSSSTTATHATFPLAMLSSSCERVLTIQAADEDLSS